MRIASLFRISIVAGILLGLSVDRVAATQCLQLGPAEEWATHALVFLGTVEAVQDTALRPHTGLGRGRIAWVRMSSIWKGIPRRDRVRVTEIVDPHGSPKLVPGGTYVFYADSSAIGWRVDVCSRTRRISDASEDLAALGKPAPVQRLPGRKLRPSR